MWTEKLGVTPFQFSRHFNTLIIDENLFGEKYAIQIREKYVHLEKSASISQFLIPDWKSLVRNCFFLQQIAQLLP